MSWSEMPRRDRIVPSGSALARLREESGVHFITLMVKNVLHRPVRTGLTAFGLSIAIAAVIILVGISWNFERSFLAIYRSKKIDLILVRAGSSNQLSSSLDVGLDARLEAIEGVADVAPSLVDTVAFEDKNLASVLVNGWVPGSHSSGESACSRAVHSRRAIGRRP